MSVFFYNFFSEISKRTILWQHSIIFHVFSIAMESKEPDFFLQTDMLRLFIILAIISSFCPFSMDGLEGELLTQLPKDVLLSNVWPLQFA